MRERKKPRTWQDCRDDHHRGLEAVRQVFGWAPRQFPEEPQEHWEQVLREEQETAKAIEGMTETEANRYVIDRVFWGKSAKSDGESGETRCGDNGKEQAGQGKAEE